MRLAYFIVAVLSAAALAAGSLRDELMEFYDVLPKVRLGYIATKHYFFDSDFKTGYKYIKSIDYNSNEMQRILYSKEVQAIINYLGLQGQIGFNVRRLEIPSGLPEDFVMERSMSSFIDEVVKVMPNDKIRSLVMEKVTSNSELGRIIRKAFDPQFKILVYQARNSKSLEGLISSLQTNKIDVDYILNVLFQLLNRWSYLTY